MPTDPKKRPLVRDGILVRSIIATVLVFFLVGVATVTFTAYATRERALQESDRRLAQLLDTVESTLRIACFVRDDGLAKEVARGLLSNTELLRVTIDDGYESLADMQRGESGAPDDTASAAAGHNVIERDILSPFMADQVIGHIRLTPDPAVIAQRIHDDVKLAAIQLGWQLALIAGTVVIALLFVVVRPISDMSNHLHGMDPTAGDRLPIPSGHANSEIGRLANDVNVLASRLVRALEDEHALRIRREVDEKKYRAIFDKAESGIFIVARNGLLSEWNPAFARMMEISSAETYRGTLFMGELPWEAPAEIAELLDNILADRCAANHDVLIKRRDDSRRWLNITLSPVGDNLLQGVVHDVSVLKAAEAQALLQAVTDPVTGLDNRTGLESHLQSHIKDQLLNDQKGFTLLIVNLDKFRQVIEGIGVPAGDEILRVVASRLSAVVKSDDTLARLNADVFCVILRSLRDSVTIENIVGRIMQSLHQPYIVDGSPIQLTASIGIAIFPNDGTDAPTLLRHSELAVDKAKGAGGNSSVFFAPTLAESAEQRRHMENDLRLAIRDKHFALFLQPIVDIQNNRLSGAEALIRWRHPSIGLISPEKFIPIAEKSGLIIDIGRWVLESACQQLLAWQRTGHDYSLSFNVSGMQIPKGLPPESVAEAIGRYGIAPHRLALEITEGILLSDVDEALAWLYGIHALGLNVSLDDFGTGYSSLSYLKRFPVQTLKIDQSFVQGMENDGNERSLVQAIIAIARSLGLNVVAEGVETADHLRLLRAMGCHYAQGYYFSHPLPAEEFAIAEERIAALLDAPA